MRKNKTNVQPLKGNSWGLALTHAQNIINVIYEGRTVR